MTADRVRRGGIYCRISKDSEREGLGVGRQEQDCRNLAEREGIAVSDVYVDNDISASTKSKKARPQYERLLSDARAGLIDVIIAYSNSRLTRRPAEWIQLVDLATHGQIRIKTVASGEFDLSKADGRAGALTIAAWDAAEAERTAERVARAHQELAEKGAHAGGPRPFGWDFNEDRTLRINESEAAVIRECTSRVLSGEKLWSIAKELKERGVRTATGKTFETQVLRRMLIRWRNCGIRSHNGKQFTEAQWPAIVDRPTFERLLAHLTDPSRKSNNRGTAVKYLLTSLAECGECGGYVVGTNEYTYRLKNGRTRVYPHAYKCPRAGCMKVMRNMADVDRHVTRVLLGVLERDGLRLFGGDPVAAEQARDRIAALEAKLALVADQYADDVITEEQMKRINAKVRPELEGEKARLQKASPANNLASFTGPSARTAWDAADMETRKRIIRQVCMRISIQYIGAGNARAYDPDAVIITWDDGEACNSASSKRFAAIE